MKTEHTQAQQVNGNANSGLRRNLLLLAAGVLCGQAGLAVAAEVPLFEAYRATGQYAIYANGLGLKDAGGQGTLTDVSITGPVQKAYLYWAGSNRPATETTSDDTIVFSQGANPGVAVTADASYVIPFERPAVPGSYYWNANHSAYVADVTQLVTQGTFDYTVSEFDMDTEFGFGLQIVYEDQNMPVRDVALYQGHDFAFSGWANAGELNRTDVVTFEFDPSSEERVLEASFFAAGGEGTDRPEQLWALTGAHQAPGDLPDELITNNLGSVIMDNPLESNNQSVWDTVTYQLVIPPGATYAAFQFESGGGSGTNTPDESFSWTAGSFALIPEPATLTLLVVGGLAALRRRR